MKSILDLGVEFFIPKKNLAKYDEIADQSKPIVDIIYELLTFDPNFMFETAGASGSVSKESEIFIKRKIKSFTTQNKKIEFVTFYFNAKSPKKSITNNFVFPDASDFLTLLHLSLVFQKINRVYKPGATLNIGLEYNFFHKFATRDLRETSEMTSILMKFKIIIEAMLKSKNHIFIYDVYEETSLFKKEFLSDIESEKFNFLRKENAIEELKRVADYYFNFVIEKNSFPSEEAARNFCIFHSLDAVGYGGAIRNLTHFERGLFENFDKKILINPRFFENSHPDNNRNEITISLLPGSFTFSFNMLTLKMRSNKWHQITFEEVRSSHFEEFFVQDLPYPFLFTEKKFRGGLK